MHEFYSTLWLPQSWKATLEKSPGQGTQTRVSKKQTAKCPLQLQQAPRAREVFCCFN